MRLQHKRFLRLWILCTVLLATIMLVLGGCGTPSAAPQSADPTPPRASIPATSASGGSDAAKDGTLKRTSEGGNVTVEVTWDRASGSSGGPLRFSVVMDTHSVDLDTIDLAQRAVLRNDSGEEVRPERWDAPKGGHHRSGSVIFPATVDGSPLIGRQTRVIELVVRDVAGVKERSFKWEISS